jgi:hypothetical protein
MPEIDFSKYPNVNFRLGEHLDNALSERGENKNTIAKRDLERFYDLLARNLPAFTLGEALLLCEALNGVRCSPDTLWGNVGAALEEVGLGERFSVDRLSLLTRIRNLSDIESQSVIDAIERYWIGPYHKSGEESRAALYRVGLVKHE